MAMKTLLKNLVHFMLCMWALLSVSVHSCISGPQEENNDTLRFALLVGGGVTESDNFPSFYANIEYVFNTLKKLGYRDDDIIVLFYGGNKPSHPIVQGKATKENFISKLNYFGEKLDSNDSLIIFRSGHGMVELLFEKYEAVPSHINGRGIKGQKCVGTEAVMKFPDGDLSYLELQNILGNIKGKQIIVILNQCFSGQFVDIALSLQNTVVITETSETELAINQTRKTIRWKHDEWPFVRCFFDGLLKQKTNGDKPTIYDAFQYMVKCNPYIEGLPIRADRPLLRENPQIKYGEMLKIGNVFIH